MVPYSINLQLRSEENRFLWKFWKIFKGSSFYRQGFADHNILWDSKTLENFECLP